MKVMVRPFGVSHAQEGHFEDVDVGRQQRCDGPCGRRDVPVACLDNSRGEYPTVNLCHECLVDLANELL